MKHSVLIILFTTTLIVRTFSQVDSTSSMDVLYKQGQDKTKAKKDTARKFGASVFGGLGSGGNYLKQGFAYGLSARAHYKIHTINIYYSLATKAEQIYGKDYDYTLYNSCYGVTYGIGLYTEMFTGSIGAGIGRFQTSATVRSKNILTGIWTHYYYDNISFCVGGQATMHITKVVGFTMQVFINSSRQITNHTELFGLEICF